MKLMQDYVPLLKVSNKGVEKRNLQLIDLHERSLNKLDAKIYFTKLKLNNIIESVNNWDNYDDREKERLKIRYEATDSELQVLEYIYKKTVGRN